ncbi:hypothetical protein MACJ_001125 [Theileria orientalis]|uniref:Uncharacterized protein n=1 Tax=Theileria orientalis TaxID=68886 RepID=A0A976M7Q9_THEOR|nr:hypothetical protein MACJ_001125 [Theileria orientalis]
MISKNCYSFNHIRNIVIILLVTIVLVSSSPPGTSKNKLESKNRVKTTTYIPSKRLKLSSSAESNSNSILEQNSTISEKISNPNIETTSEDEERVVEVFKKFDFLARIFYIQDEKLYRTRQEEFIEQIRMMMLELIEDTSPECKSAMLYYLGRTCSNTVEQYRNEMAQAITFIKLKMFEQLSALCSVLEDVLDNVKIFQIINKECENTSIWEPYLPNTTKKHGEIESEDSIEMAFNKIRLGIEGTSRNKEEMTEETGSLSYILPNSTASDCYIMDREIGSECSELEEDCDSRSNTPEENMDERSKRQIWEEYGISIESEEPTGSKPQAWETGSVDSYMDSNSMAVVRSIKGREPEWDGTSLRSRRNFNAPKKGVGASGIRGPGKKTSYMESTRKDGNIKQPGRDTSAIKRVMSTAIKNPIGETSSTRVTTWDTSGIRQSNMGVISEERPMQAQKQSETGREDDIETSEETEGLVMVNDVMLAERGAYNFPEIPHDAMYNETSRTERLLMKKNCYLEREKWNSEYGINDMKKFISHIKEGYMPKFRPSESKLAEAFTASIIIMQETGMIDYLMGEYKMKQANCRFIKDMLFEVTREREEYKEDIEAADYLTLNNFYEFNKFTKSKRRQYESIKRGENDIKQAAIQLGIKTFPKVSVNIENRGGFGVVGEEHYEGVNDLEEVLLKREITVLIHPKEYEVFLNFYNRKMSSFYNRYLALAVKIMEKHYFRHSPQRIRIKYRRATDPLVELMQGKGHMTGMYFVMENKFPSVALFGSRTETMKVPLLSYRSFIMVHKRYGVNDLKGWQNLMRNPQDEKRIIITNFKSDMLFAHAGSYKVVQIVLTNQLEAPLQKMLEFNPTSGVFWGIDNQQYSYGDFSVIEFPYRAIQGPHFRKDV